jgi:hypothetical protein
MDVTRRDHNNSAAASIPIRIYRRDGSNRIHEATCTMLSGDWVKVQVPAVFPVGQVVELLPTTPTDDLRRYEARVMYRNSDQYGLCLIAKRAINETF